MSEQKPETKHPLGQDVEDSIAHNLGINTNGAGSVGNTPDATKGQQGQERIGRVQRHTLGRESRAPK